MLDSKNLSDFLSQLELSLKAVADGDYSAKIDCGDLPELASLCQQFGCMTDSLRKHEQQKNGFIDDFMHELKTPVASIAGFAALLKKADGKKKEEYTDIILRESLRLSALSESMLRLSRLEKQDELSEKTRFNLTEQLRNAIVLLDTKWTEKNIEFCLEGDEVCLCADENLLFQLWLNLLDNAVKFSPRGSAVTVKILCTGTEAEILIKDCGCGMDEETAARAFEKLFRGKSALSQPGNGIGLALSKKICELHGGKIEIASTDESGTVLRIILPLT